MFKDLDQPLNRRQFFKAIIEIPALLSAIETSQYIEALGYQSIEQTITHQYVPNLSSKLDGLRIINWADMHLGDTKSLLNLYTLPTLIDSTNDVLYKTNANPEKDILILNGDLSNQATFSSEGDYPETDTNTFKQAIIMINKIPIKNKFVVFGNHDNNNSNLSDFKQILEDNGFKIIDGRYIDHLDELRIIGLPDYTTQKQWYNQQYLNNLKHIISSGPPTQIIATHNAEAMDGGGVLPFLRPGTKTFHGHTHGGYIDTGIFTAFLLEQYVRHKLNYHSQFYAGNYRLDNNINVNISTGISDYPLNRFPHRPPRSAIRQVTHTKLTTMPC